MTESLIGFGVLLFLAFLRMPLGLALGLVGGVGLAFVTSERAAIASAARLVIDYDKDNIPPATLKKIKKYVNAEDFTVERVSKISHAATSLCMWVHAMDVYAAVAKEVGPKKEKLDKMNAVLKEAQDSLAAKQADLQAILDKVAELVDLLARQVGGRHVREALHRRDLELVARAAAAAEPLRRGRLRWDEGRAARGGRVAARALRDDPAQRVRDVRLGGPRRVDERDEHVERRASLVGRRRAVGRHAALAGRQDRRRCGDGCFAGVPSTRLASWHIHSATAYETFSQPGSVVMECHMLRP